MLLTINVSLSSYMSFAVVYMMVLRLNVTQASAGSGDFLSNWVKICCAVLEYLVL